MKSTVLALVALLLLATAARAETELVEQIRQLSSSSESERMAAGNWFAAHGEEHLDEIIELLPDHDEQLSYGSALAIGLMGPKAGRALPELVDQLTNPDITDVVVASIMRLTDDWPKIFTQYTHHETSYARQVGAKAFGLSGHADKAIPELTELLADEDPDVAKAACRALMWYPRDSKPAQPALRGLLAHGDASVRATALFTLELMDSTIDNNTKAAMRGLLQDPDADVRSAAINAVVKTSLRDDSLVGELAGMLEDEEPVVRVNAAYALSRFGERAAPAVGKLADTLTRKLWYLAPYTSDLASNNLWAPLTALGAIGKAASPALPQIRELLKDQYQALNAAEAIWLISGDATELEAILEVELSSGDTHRILEGLGMARDMGEDAKDLLPEISRLLLSEEAVVRQGSVEVMSVIANDPGMAAEMYAGLLGGATPDERLVILNRLREFGPDARPALDEVNALLAGDDEFELALAATVMYSISGEVQPSRDVLMDVLAGDNQDAIAVAAHCLRLMRNYAEPALPRLREIAADATMSDSAREAAQRAVTVIESS